MSDKVQYRKNGATMSDRLFLECAYCGATLYARSIDTGKNPAPSELERAYLKAARHIRKEHVRRR